MSQNVDGIAERPEGGPPRDLWALVVLACQGALAVSRSVMPFARDGWRALRGALGRSENPSLARAVDRCLWGASPRWGLAGAVVGAIIPRWLMVSLWMVGLAWWNYEPPRNWWWTVLQGAAGAAEWLIWTLTSPAFAVCVLVGWRLRVLVQSERWHNEIAAIPGAVDVLFDRLLRSVAVLALGISLVPAVVHAAVGSISLAGGNSGQSVWIPWARSEIGHAWLNGGEAWTGLLAIVAEPMAWAALVANSTLYLLVGLICFLVPHRARTRVGCFLAFAYLAPHAMSLVWWIPSSGVDLLPRSAGLFVQALAFLPLRCAMYAVVCVALVGVAQRLFARHGEAFLARQGDG